MASAVILTNGHPLLPLLKAVLIFAGIDRTEIHVILLHSIRIPYRTNKSLILILLYHKNSNAIFNLPKIQISYAYRKAGLNFRRKAQFTLFILSRFEKKNHFHKCLFMKKNKHHTE
jgi:hypothetical protein